MPPIPIMRPQLPIADRISPYLALIDRSRTYSNFGPLVQSLEDRLAAHFGLSNGTIATVANATLGLTLALAAQGARPGSLCAIPAWTFVASAHAAVMAGLVPYFVDVDLESWALDVDGMADTIGAAPGPVGAVMAATLPQRPSRSRGTPRGCCGAASASCTRAPRGGRRRRRACRGGSRSRRAPRAGSRRRRCARRR